jgi:predicted MFS family arabinose efflux permease
MNTAFSTPTPFTAYQKVLLLLLALLQFTVVLDFMIIAPIGDNLIKSLHINTQQFGLVVSSYIFSAALSGVAAAGFIDKYDKKKVLLFFFTGFIVGTLFCAISNSYITLLLARIVTGLFGGVLSSIIMTVVTDLFVPNQRGRAMSSVQMAFAGSQILGIPLGLFIANNWGWNYTFGLMVLISLPLFFVILWKVKPIDEHLSTKSEKNPFVHLWHTVINRQYQVGFVALIFLALGFMLNPFASIFLVNNIQISHEQLPLIFMVTGASSMIVMPLVGKIADRINKFKVYTFGTILAIIVVIVYTNLPVVPIWVVMIVNVFVFSGITSRMVPFQALNSMIPKPTDRGAYMGISASLQQVSIGLGTVLASQIVYQETPSSPLKHYDWLGYSVVLCSLLSIYFVYRVYHIVQKQA